MRPRGLCPQVAHLRFPKVGGQNMWRLEVMFWSFTLMYCVRLLVLPLIPCYARAETSGGGEVRTQEARDGEIRYTVLVT